MFEITYHTKIVDDLSTLSSVHKNSIRKAVEEKLQTQPVFFGKPLQFSLYGLRSLRVGDYRIIFQLKKNEVYIVLIAHRSIVYKAISTRI
jgi:mRNA-degrading endonuclease RelE of RelBE toxin-antitoxin system